MCITEYNEAETMQMIREESREEGREEGRTQEIYSLVQDGDISLERAAQRLGVTVSVLKSKMENSGYRYSEI